MTWLSVMTVWVLIAVTDSGHWQQISVHSDQSSCVEKLATLTNTTTAKLECRQRTRAEYR